MAESKIRKALELLRERGWTKGPAILSKTGPMCVGLAMHAVYKEPGKLFASSTGVDGRTLRTVASQQWPARWCDSDESVPVFNDHPDTTWADIEVWMEKAAVMREEAVDE